MAKKHHTRNRAPDIELSLNDDGRWPHEVIQCAFLADIRRATEESRDVQRQTLRVLQRMDRRLAKRVKLR